MSYATKLIDFPKNILLDIVLCVLCENMLMKQVGFTPSRRC